MSNISISTVEQNILLSISEYSSTIMNGSDYIIIFDSSLNIIKEMKDIDFDNLTDILYYNENDIYIFSYFFTDSIIKYFEDFCNLKLQKLENDNGVVLLHMTDNDYNILLDSRSDEIIHFKYTLTNKSLSSFNVLSILDEFTHSCFKYECNLTPLSTVNWETQIIDSNPDIFLCESVWKSVYSNLSVCDKNNYDLIKKIVSFLKLNSIPTVFWNKEDDVNYNRFIDVAKLFDIILTTDERCIQQYKIDTGNENIYCLEFACQPKIHNPSNTNRKNDVFFAGRWYNNMVDRKYSIETLIDIPIFKDKSVKLDIYDRKYINKYKSFPLNYDKYLKKKLDYNQLCEITKNYKIMLNVNTITDSNTMFSRRVYEGLSTGCVVLSTHSVGIRKKFKDTVKISNSRIESEVLITQLLQDEREYNKLSHKCYTSVINTENYYNRFKRIIDIVGIEYDDHHDSVVSIILNIKSSDSVDKIYNFYKDCIEVQTYKNIVTTFFITNNKKLLLLKKKIKSDKCKFYHFKSSAPVIDKINEMKNIHITVFNVNDIYLKDFIKDSMLAYLYIDSSVKMIGKSCYVDNKNIVYNEHLEHKYVSSLNKNTIIYSKNENKEVINSLFENEKSIYTRVCNKYSVDRWNYVECL
jgi:hypothetical protein